ncbi:asparagine--tRNA ligase [Treponema primitia ZAS-2]|uniref:Asparagine--tRNA ligase n=1 Tax=Treponema primitia (strain ATCC BAA-887 / DSM 12427 / ZAS-2) TaxID=545694 RepID=F5YII8_TREPZ|nr:asparagine--tRNA ligase [Treponema primitia]AEF85577.1 asparagine--tRNA ligase [Treponema primitia ZAS-2]
MTNLLVKELLALPPESQDVTVRGWVRTKRDLKNLVFVEVNDGSAFDGIQCTFDRGGGSLGAALETSLSALSTGASVEVRGALVPSPASGQAVEVAATVLTLIGDAPAENTDGIPAYPLQKKRHSLEFLREIAHLRARTNTFGAVARVRSRLGFAVHQFFQERGFQYLNTPIITASDAEGAGAMFQVTTLDLDALGRSGKVPDYGKDFFGKRSYLTVSGQLEAETYAAALSRVYTFGPTFRAENSNTTRHLAEFWMIEPEAAFAELEDNMALAEDFLKYIFKTALSDCSADLAFFDAHVEKGIIDTLRSVVDLPFVHMSYTDAMTELERAIKAGTAFEFKPYWGCDLQSEHEKYLTEKVVKGPLIVTDYPKEIKAFYMKMNDDNKTVRAMDVLVPRLGEIIGGSQREDSLARLEARIREMGMNPADYGWYLDLRRYGTVPHSGFGVGFERLIQYVTGMANIRDVIPYPRAVGQAEF